MMYNAKANVTESSEEFTTLYTSDIDIDNATTAWLLYNNQPINTLSRNTTFLPCNNPESPINEVTAKRVEGLLQMTILPLLEVFGVVTNVINIIVFVKQGLRDRINLCLFSLALADLSFLLVIFSAKFFSFLGLIDSDLEEFWSQKFLNTLLGFVLGTMNISNAMTTIISVERCVCVLSPFIAKKFLKTKYMAVTIVVMSAYILGFYSLLNMKYVTVQAYDPITNRMRWSSQLSYFYTSSRVIIDILYNHLLSLAIPCTSLVIVVMTTTITVAKLRSTMAWRQGMANKTQLSMNDKKDGAVTKMLNVICLLYVCTMTPSVVQAFFRSFVPGYIPSGKHCNIFVIIQTIAHTCEVTNSAFSFVIYMSMGTRFRTTVKELFGRREKLSAMLTTPITSSSFKTGKRIAY